MHEYYRKYLPTKGYAPVRSCCVRMYYYTIYIGVILSARERESTSTLLDVVIAVEFYSYSTVRSRS